ncbi:MAG: alpha/beta fold hydrolase [Dehalococcoidia bacterium]|nr:alpha/beta fold hydrolase [Dehalococcoidia bacterium]
MRKEVEFQSKGTTCRGWLCTPDGGSGPYPVVVMAGGWCYVKEIVMPHYVDAFLERGVAALLFDYRTFGASDGEPRQHIDPWGQIEDYKNAISYVESLPEIDATRIAAWGISYSGGHVLIAGATDPRVKCIVSQIPVVEGHATMRRVHGETRFQDLLDLVLEDRRKRYQDPSSGGTIPMSAVNPAETLSTWPFRSIYEGFDGIKRQEAPRHEHYSTVESVEMLLNYTVFPYTRRILNTPTLMIVAEHDEITLWDLEIDAFNSIPAPNKKLVVLPEVTHMTLYTQRSHLEVARTAAAEWLGDHLTHG